MIDTIADQILKIEIASLLGIIMITNRGMVIIIII